MGSLSFLVPTPGRAELANHLGSLEFQLGPDDEVIVIGDTYDGPLDETEALVRSHGRQYRYIEHNAGYHAFGHPQLNAGIAAARGDWLAFNDDDDVWVPGCVEQIRETVDGRDAPVLFRYLNYYGFFVWMEKGLFRENYIGGHCLVCPNDPHKIGSWTDNYTGDWNFVNDTVAFYGLDNILWSNTVIAIARPSKMVLNEIEHLRNRSLVS